MVALIDDYLLAGQRGLEALLQRVDASTLRNSQVVAFQWDGSVEFLDF